jgi:hypothetical protein
MGNYAIEGHELLLSYPYGQEKTPLETGEPFLVPMYAACRGATTMNTLNFICAFLITLLLSITWLASSLKLFFTTEELGEMGIRLDPSGRHGEEAAV